MKEIGFLWLCLSVMGLSMLAWGWSFSTRLSALEKRLGVLENK